MPAKTRAARHDEGVTTSKGAPEPRRGANSAGSVGGSADAATAANVADAVKKAGAANVADLVRAAAERSPTATALISTDETRTWGELDRAGDAGALALAAAGNTAALRGQTVVLALPTGADLAAALIATLRAGAVAVPVDPAATDLDRVAARVGAALVITDNRLETSPLPVIAAADIAQWWNAERAPADRSAGQPTEKASTEFSSDPAAGGEDLALLARASRPGPPVMLSHRALIAAARAVAAAPAMELQPADRVLQALPLFHVVGLVSAFLPAAIAGAAVVIPDSADPATRAETVLAAARAHRVSVLPAESTLYRQLDRVDGFERALATVRLMTSGSSPLDPADFATIRTATGQAVREGYGISEAASAVTSTLMVPSAKPGAVGRPYPGVEIRIDNHLAEAADEPVDDEPAERSDLEDLVDIVDIADPAGGLGRIAIRGETLFSGYWPQGTGGPDESGWFVTNDIGYLDDAGELHLVDRADETITVAGFTVYPREVEDALVTHPHVADAAVVGVPGRSGQTVVAVVVPQPGTRPTSDDVTEYLTDLLPPFKRPTDYLLVDVLPRTEVGRLDRRTVRQEFAAARGIDLGTPLLTAVPGASSEDDDGGGDVTPERVAGLGRLGSRLPAAKEGRGRRGDQDTDEDLF